MSLLLNLRYLFLALFVLAALVLALGSQRDA
jgi:hypothetical protein